MKFGHTSPSAEGEVCRLSMTSRYTVDRRNLYFNRKGRLAGLLLLSTSTSGSFRMLINWQDGSSGVAV